MSYKTTNWASFERRDTTAKANKVSHKDSKAYVIPGKAGEDFHQANLDQAARILARLKG